MTPSVFRMAPCVYMKQLTCYSVCHQAHNLQGKRMHTGQMATWRHSILVWCLFFHIHDCKCFTVLVWLVDAKILITFLFQACLEKTTGSCVKHKQVYSSLISTFLGFFFSPSCYRSPYVCVGKIHTPIHFLSALILITSGHGCRSLFQQSWVEDRFTIWTSCQFIIEPK